MLTVIKDKFYILQMDTDLNSQHLIPYHLFNWLSPSHLILQAYKDLN